MGLITAQSSCLRWDKTLSKDKHRQILGGTGGNQAGGLKGSQAPEYRITGILQSAFNDCLISDMQSTPAVMDWGTRALGRGFSPQLEPREQKLPPP